MPNTTKYNIPAMIDSYEEITILSSIASDDPHFDSVNGCSAYQLAEQSTVMPDDSLLSFTPSNVDSFVLDNTPTITLDENGRESLRQNDLSSDTSVNSRSSAELRPDPPDGSAAGDTGGGTARVSTACVSTNTGAIIAHQLNRYANLQIAHSSCNSRGRGLGQAPFVQSPPPRTLQITNSKEHQEHLGTLDDSVKEMITILRKSPLLSNKLPNARRLTLIVTLLESPTPETAWKVIAANLAASQYIGQDMQDDITKMAIQGNWKKLRALMQCPDLESISDDDTNTFRDMVTAICVTSEKLNIPVQERIKNEIKEASSTETLRRVLLKSCKDLTKASRKMAKDDIKEKRYDRLVLPNRFRCEATTINNQGGINNQGSIPKYKIIILGDSQVGKSGIIHRLMNPNKKFTKLNMTTTVRLDLDTQTIETAQGTVKVQVWDTAGQEKFNCITRAYYRNVHGVLLVYDITNAASLESLSDRWLKELDKHDVKHNVKLLLVGTKSDLRDSRRVTHEMAQTFCKSSKMEITEMIETSARGNDVYQAFETFIGTVHAVHRQAPQTGGMHKNKNKTGFVDLGSSDPKSDPESTRSGCC